MKKNNSKDIKALDKKAKIKEKSKLKLKKKVKRIKKSYKKKSRTKSIITFVATVAAILATVKLMAKQFNKKNNVASKLNIKDVFVCIGAKTYDFAEKIERGAIISSYLGSANCDFSACEFEDNSFVTIKSFGSKVNIIMPENVNVKFDFVNTGSYIKWNVEDDGFDETRPTVYVALKTVFSYVNVEK